MSSQSLTTGRRTAVGSAHPEVHRRDRGDRQERRAQPCDETRLRTPAPPPVPKGAYAPAIIVLLTDGASNAGPEPLDAAAAGGGARHPRLHDRLRDGDLGG